MTVFICEMLLSQVLRYQFIQVVNKQNSLLHRHRLQLFSPVGFLEVDFDDIAGFGIEGDVDEDAEFVGVVF